MSRAFLTVLLVSLAAQAPAYGRQVDPSPRGLPGTDGGLLVGITGSGFRVGGYYRDSLRSAHAMMVELSLGAEKSSRETAFFDRFGRKSIPGKRNYMLTVPIRLGYQRRLFADRIEDNFRPFLQASLGPTIGWQYPYFDDCNENGLFDPEDGCGTQGEERLGSFRALGRGALRLGAGGSVGIGAYFGRSDRGPRGLRIGYAMTYFLEGVELLEADIEPSPRHYFGSAEVTFFLGRLF